MKKLYKKGFTLIELLIVIAILSILAVGLIATLDPLEQVNRATDTARKATATDLIHAADRFYASNQISVACDQSTGDTTCAAFTGGLNTSTTVKLSTLGGANTNSLNNYLFEKGETKSPTSFSANPQAKNIDVGLKTVTPTTGTTLIVCYKPVSKAQKSFAVVGDVTSTIFRKTGNGIPVQEADLANCPATTANSCYQCVTQQ